MVMKSELNTKITRILIYCSKFDHDACMKVRHTNEMFIANESIAGNQHNLGIFGRVTVHSRGGQWMGL